MHKRYYVSKTAQSNGDHEVHDELCKWLPVAENRTILGEYGSCHGAMLAAKKYYSQVDGCIHCCRPCHTK